MIINSNSFYNPDNFEKMIIRSVSKRFLKGQSISGFFRQR